MVNIEYSSGGIVFRKNLNRIEILFILDPYGKWAFPKGHIEKGEEISVAALREVSEETGINPKDLNIVLELGETDFRFRHQGKKIHKFLKLYLIKAKSSATTKPQVEEKIKKVKWVGINHAVNFFDYKNGQAALKKAIDFLNKNYGT